MTNAQRNAARSFACGFLLSLACGAATAQAPMRNIPALKLSYVSFTQGNYTGEVNRAGQPEGYGMCVFPDKSSYVGQFLAGRVTGEGVSIDPTRNDVVVARWVDGEKTGQYFKVVDKDLKLMLEKDGASAIQRTCWVRYPLLCAVDWSDVTSAKAAQTRFEVHADSNKAEVFLCAHSRQQLRSPG